MPNNLDFILKLNDQFTAAFKAAGGVSHNVTNQISSNISRVTSSSRTMSASVSELRQRLEGVNQIRFGTRLTSEFNSATRQARELEKQLDKLEQHGQKKSGGGMVGNFVKGNLIAGAIQGGLSMASDFVTGSYQKALQNKSLSNAINTTTGGQGKEAMAQTKSISDKYGINYEASLEGVRTLTGGLMSMNMPLKEQMKIFEGVSTGVAAMGLTAEQSKGAMLALGQMASKGTVSAEELRGQLGERIPGAFGLAAKSMGVTEAQLNKMLQKGDIAAKDFLPRLAAQMQKTFGAAALENANGPQAVAERFNNALYNMQVTIGQGIMPLITPMLTAFTNIANTALPVISSVLSQVVTFISGINFEGGVWGVWINLVYQYGMVVWNGVVRIAGVIWSIIQGVVKWAANSQMIQDIFWAIGKFAEGIFTIVGQVGDAIKWIWDHVIKPILDSIEWVYKTVKGLLGGKSQLEVIQTIKTVGSGAPNIPGVGAFGVTPISLNAPAAQPSSKAGSGASLDNTSKSKADSINSGGQKSIVINIGKQIEKLEVHVMDAKEGANEIEAMVRESMKRVMYSLNGVSV